MIVDAIVGQVRVMNGSQLDESLISLILAIHTMTNKGGTKMIVLIIILSLVLVGATFCTLTKAGKQENICNYNYKED